MKQIDFSDGKIANNILQAALPMLVAQLLTLLYSIVDRIYIGRIPGTGSLALGGIGLCFPVILTVTAFTNLFGLGGSPLCSIQRGKGDFELAQQIMNTAFYLLTAASAVILVLGEILASPLLTLFGATAANLPIALEYLRIYLLGTFFAMVSTGMNPYINAQGFSRAGMITVVIGALSNIVLDPVFIFVFGMGIRGAAIATVLSQGLSALFVLKFLTGSQTELRLLPPSKVIGPGTRDISAQIVSLGAAPFIMQFTNSLVSISCNSVLSSYGGEVYVSIMTVVSSVRQILDTPVMAITEGTSPVISFNYGARRPGQIRKAIMIMSAASITYTAVTWALIEYKPAFFIRIFLSDPSFIEKAIPALHLYFFAFIFQALQYSGQTVFKALGKKKHAIFFSLFRKVVMVVPLTYLLPRLGLGARGVFIAEPVSNFVGGTACFTVMLLTVLPELRAMDNKRVI